jgi:hypothetical protein
MKRPLWPTLLLLFLAGRCPAQADAGGLTFERDVRPILKANCVRCHGEDGQLKGKLDLRLRRLAVRGGKSGPAVAPGDRDGSRLYRRIRAGEMPPGKKKLTAAEVAVIGRWIGGGAKTARPEPVEVAGSQITPEERGFWSFRPIRRPPVPAVRHPDRVRTPIDAFLLARLEQQGLSFAPDADRPTLIRRAWFDLLGLPPPPEEVDRFVADRAPDAYERLIDRLLASPQYGERWGRHWLDVAGYADSEGYTSQDVVRPYAYKYRDYVLGSLSADKPFDEFLLEQIAGDEMVRYPHGGLTPDDVEKLTATGFLSMAPDGTSSPGVNLAEASNQVVADTVKAVSTGLLGLTVGCAQCHDHRYDPIPQADYYRLRAIFEPAYDPAHWRSPPMRRISLATDADRARARQVEAEAARIDGERLRKQQEYIERTFQKELKKLPEAVRETVRLARDTPPAKRTPQQKQLLKEYPSVNVTAGSLYLYDPKAADDLKRYAQRAAAVRAKRPAEDYVRAVTEVPGQVPVTHLFARGDISQPRQALAPGGLSVLDDVAPLRVPDRSPGLVTTGRRLAFALWLTGDRNPLTPRVLVNRVWMHHFGRGIVGTPGDFGALGERPSHPELLDWLASDFTAGGWRLKHLHRLILTSTAYRQASRRHAAGERADPDDRLLWRMPLRRLEAEEVRDSILAVSGKLNARMHGPAVPVMEDEVGQFVVGVENKNGENRPGPVLPMHGEEFRRSVYVQVRRSRPLSLLETFDMPVMEPTCPARSASTVAPQSLLLMNNDFVLAQAEAFAERVRREAGPDARAQVARAWRLAFAREPGPAEVREALAFLSEQTAGLSGRPGALACLCQALLSANGFLYVD